jgi:hypothetical protein
VGVAQTFGSEPTVFSSVISAVPPTSIQASATKVSGVGHLLPSGVWRAARPKSQTKIGPLASSVTRQALPPRSKSASGYSMKAVAKAVVVLICQIASFAMFFVPRSAPL